MLVSAPSRAEISDEPIVLVDLGDLSDTPLKSDLQLSDNGRYLTHDARDGALRDYVHIDLETGVVTDVELDRVTPSEGGEAVIGEILGGDGTRYIED